MEPLQKILENYKILCDHCDAVWERVRDTYPNEIACRKGCGICCELQNVNQLEAHVILTHIENHYDGGEERVDGGATSTSSCPFLNGKNQSCLIYEARPTICRTHGLILRSSEFSKSHAPSCPYNFPSRHPNDFPADLTIDIDRVTKNLVNLNLAFCMVTGINVKDGSKERVPLKELRKRISSILALFFAAVFLLVPGSSAKTRANAGNASPTILRQSGVQAEKHLSPSEFEAKFRPFFEERVNARRGGRGGTRSVSAVRPTSYDVFMMARMWDRLTPEFRALYRQATDIYPEDYDKIHISPMGKFKIFYSTIGVNAVNLTDTIGIGANGDPSAWRLRTRGANGVPDYIDETAFALDSSWSMVVNRFGFAEPINAPDPDGANDYYGVLIEFMEDYGVTWPYDGSTPGFSSYIAINSDFSKGVWANYLYKDRPLDALRVSCAHEFMHASQYAMVWTEWLDNLPVGWLDGVALLMEEVAFPDINDYLEFLDAYFRNPGITLLGNNNQYANSAILKYIYEKTNPIDSIGFVRAIHDNNLAQRMMPFQSNLERASLEHAGKSWAEVLNGYHTESYFTGDRARRPAFFVTDAELMGTWRLPTTSGGSDTKTANARAAAIFTYEPRPDHPDTLTLNISGQRDASIEGKTWAASVVITEKNGGVEVISVPMDRNGVGGIEITDWKERANAILITSNASPSSRRTVTVRTDDVTDTPITPGAQLNIYPNALRAGSTTPLRFSGGNITEIKIVTQEGKLLDYYNNRGANPRFGMNADGVIEWFPNQRLAPGICFASVVTQNPLSNRKNTLRRKIMILP